MHRKGIDRCISYIILFILEVQCWCLPTHLINGLPSICVTSVFTHECRCLPLKHVVQHFFKIFCCCRILILNIFHWLSLKITFDTYFPKGFCLAFSQPCVCLQRRFALQNHGSCVGKHCISRKLHEYFTLHHAKDFFGLFLPPVATLSSRFLWVLNHTNL